MSNELAIAAVTSTLKYVLSRYAKLNVTTKSPDQAARDASGARINIFLYHTAPNATWRNMDVPGRVRPGEQGQPPLALNLYYLLTAYGQDGDLADQKMLGQAMRVLHDRPILQSKDIKDAAANDRDLSTSDLDEQVEKVRVVPDVLNIEEMSRLWTTFQTQYRVSAAYQASVVLIESQKPKRVPLPVLSRGAADRGVRTIVGLGAVLDGVENRAAAERPNMPAAIVDSTITVNGTGIPGTGLKVVIRDPKQAQDRRVLTDVIAELTPQPVEDAGSLFRVKLAASQAAWVAGMLTLEVAYEREGRSVASNAVSLALAPALLVNDGDNSVVSSFQRHPTDADRTLLQVALAYPVGPNRRVMLVLNRVVTNQQDPEADRRNFFQLEQFTEATATDPSRPVFDVTNVPPGTYWIRLRVDGVDSLLLQEAGSGLEFDTRQQVTL
jgi:hypothetical protein